jgi:DNA-binding protein HU-beta
MTKQELVNKVYEMAQGNVNKKMVNEMIDNVFNTITKTIKKDKRFSLPAFGTWTLRNRRARKGRNPQTGAVIHIPASRTVGFKPSPNLKSQL